MKREIKFRYRFTDGKNWIMRVFTLPEIVRGGPYEVISDAPLLKDYRQVGEDQFTGLHDKNGKEIYEGDIIEATTKSGKKGLRGVVAWEDYGWTVFRPVEAFEVIGNIWENPELLKQ